MKNRTILLMMLAVVSLLVSIAAIVTIIYAALLGELALVYIGFAVALVAVVVMDAAARNM